MGGKESSRRDPSNPGSRRTSAKGSRSKSNSYKPEATGLELHKDALEDMKERAELNKKRPKMAIKKVNVAANQKFEEASDADSYNRKKRSSLPPVGEVRKYVKEMKD